MNLRYPVKFQEFQDTSVIENKYNLKRTSLVNNYSIFFRNNLFLKSQRFRIELIKTENISTYKILGLTRGHFHRNEKKKPKRVKVLLTNSISSGTIKFRNFSKSSARGGGIFPVQNFHLFIQEHLYQNLIFECESGKERFNRLKSDVSLFKKNIALKEKNLISILQIQLLKRIIPALDDLERAKNIRIDQIKSKKKRKFFRAYCNNLQMVYDSFIKNLELTVIAPSIGELFNDNFHTIIGLTYNESVKNNSILEVMKSGYIFNGEVLDSAQIIVSTTNPNHPNLIIKKKSKVN